MTGLQDRAIDRIVNGDDARFNAMGIELKDPAKAPPKAEETGSFFDSVKKSLGDTLDRVFDKSAKYDQAAQEAYQNKESIVSQFAAGYRSHQMDPVVMQQMEYLKDKGMLKVDGDSDFARSARISSSLMDVVKSDPSSFGLQATGVATYDQGKQDVTLFAAAPK